MMMPGRKFSAGASYRYGFNGKEIDNELQGEGNSQDYGLRIYDPRIGKFLSVDPLIRKFAYFTPYEFAANKPIKYLDIDGAQTPEEELKDAEMVREEIEESRENRANNLKEEEDRESENFARRMRNDPAFRTAQQFRTNLSNTLYRSVQRESYWRNAFEAARFILTPGGVQDNKENGDRWDDMVRDAMLKNPTCIGVGRQISIKVVGMVNGKEEIANIRIDNVGVSVSGNGQPVLDFKEAKFSIGEIKENNILQTLTPQQQAAVNIIITGSNVNIFIRGQGSVDKLNSIFNNNGIQFKLAKGQSILGNIGEVKIVVPSGKLTTTNAGSATTPPKQNSTNGQQTPTNNPTPKHH